MMNVVQYLLALARKKFLCEVGSGRYLSPWVRELID